MTTYKHIRALSRAITVLEHLNAVRESSSAAVASAIGLPKTTTYRILQSLIECGLVYYTPSQGCFRLTPQVDGLAPSLAAESWLAGMVEPILVQLSEAVLWPSEFCLPTGREMRVAVGTHRMSPLSVPQATVPRLEPADSPAGQAFSAFSPSPRPDDRARLQAVKANGFALASAPSDGEPGALAVPVCSGGRAIGALQVLWLSSQHDTDAVAVERLLPPLRAARRRIEEALRAAPDPAAA